MFVEAFFFGVTHDAIDGFGIAEEDEGGDAEDAEASRCLHVLVDV